MYKVDLNSDLGESFGAYTSSAHCSPSPNRPASASSMSSPTAHSTTWLRLT